MSVSSAARARLRAMGQRGLKTAYALGRSTMLNEQARLAEALPENALLRGYKVVPVPYEQDRWWVRSDTDSSAVYMIEREGDEWHCTCDCHLMGGNECKHIIKVKAEIKKAES